MSNIVEQSGCVFVTGAAGFIGFHLSCRLMEMGISVVGLDNLNDYYDVSLKEARLRILKENPLFSFIKGDIADKTEVFRVFEKIRPEVVINLAAQAGVRYSFINPDSYIRSNIIGFFNILEACREYPVKHLLYASSSSVYGANKKTPFSTADKTDTPVSLYAATKKSNEALAYSYCSSFGIKATGLRFFTVYGPFGRPDMAYFSFTDNIVEGKSIKVFNIGNLSRDFTYIDDIVEGDIRVMLKAPARKTGPDGLPMPPYAIYNIANSHPENLLDFVDVLYQELVHADVLPLDYDLAAHVELVPMQPGDVQATYADTSALERDFGFKPSTSLRDGLRAFAEWYSSYKSRNYLE